MCLYLFCIIHLVSAGCGVGQWFLPFAALATDLGYRFAPNLSLQSKRGGHILPHILLQAFSWSRASECLIFGSFPWPPNIVRLCKRFPTSCETSGFPGEAAISPLFWQPSYGQSCYLTAVLPAVLAWQWCQMSRLFTWDRLSEVHYRKVVANLDRAQTYCLPTGTLTLPLLFWFLRLYQMFTFTYLYAAGISTKLLFK